MVRERSLHNFGGLLHQVLSLVGKEIYVRLVLEIWHLRPNFKIK